MTVTNKPSAGEPVVEQRIDPLRGTEYICTNEFWNFLDELTEAVNATVASVADESIATNAGVVLGILKQRIDEFQPPTLSLPEVIEHVRLMSDQFDSHQVRKAKDIQSRTLAAGATTFTTTGDEFIECLNTAPATITMNAYPSDGEDAIIAARNAQVTASGPINGAASLIITSAYDTAHLRYSVASSEWVIV